MKIFTVASFMAFLQLSQVYSSQRDVYDSIFQEYRKDFRPVRNDSAQMTIQIRLKIFSLLEVNEHQEYIKVTAVLNQWWKDEYLIWDPSQFDGITQIKIPADKVWLPDIIVESSSLEPEHILSPGEHTVFIKYDGTVYLSYPFVLTNYCKMVIEEYPFDTQECIIVVESWSYVKEEIILEHVPASRGNASIAKNNNTVWEILPYVNDTFDFTVDDGRTFAQIWYRQKIKRKSTYYIWVLIVPTFIVTAMSLAGLYAPFNNKGEREEEVTMGLTTLLTLAIILTMVTGEMPRGARLPVLGLFVLIEIIMIVIAMAVSVAVMFLHQRATTRSWPVPHWMNWFFDPKRKIADKQQIITDKTHRDSRQLDVPLYSTSHPESYQAFLMRACLRQLNEINGKVSEWLIEKEKKKVRSRRWRMIFDAVDLSLFLLFQFIHAIVFILIFSPYF